MKDYRRFVAVLFALALSACATKMPAPVVERAGTPSGLESAAAPLYTVKKGDTLYSIALEQGVNYRDLAAWNYIDDPARIRVGQQLRVRPPAPPAASDGSAVTQPIASGAPIVEQRPLDGGAAPVAPAASSQLKTEPRAGKLPYSEQTLALAQGVPTASEPAANVAPPPAVAKESAPADPDDVPWIWPSSGKLIGQFSESGSKGIDIAGRAGDPVIAAGDGKVVYSGSGLRGYGKLLIVKHNATFLSAYAHNRALLVKEGQAVSKGQTIAEMGDSDSDHVKLHFEIRRQGKPVDPLKYLPRR